MGLKTACLSLTALFLVVFVFISIISDDIQGIEGEDEVKTKRAKEKVKSNVNKRESGYMDDFGNDEIHVGGKRFKLFEKKHLNYKKAAAYCKKNEGKLAEAMNLEEMRRLQLLLMRARSIGNDMWVGADKKEWKKHSLKMQRRPNFGPDPMLFGGGPTEMCPALSVSTRSLLPVSCIQNLPFICEFGPGTGKSGNKATKADAGSKSKSKAKPKIEMRRKREIPLSTSPSSNLEETTLLGEDETTETYITESPAAAAAEHNIGFSPHVEHIERESISTPGNTVIASVDTAGTAMSESQSNTKATTTLDPDQMLIDLIDEQTVNLTAIELESLNTSALPVAQTSPSTVYTDAKASQKLVEFIDNNDITENASPSTFPEVEYANNSIILAEEFQDSTNSSDSPENLPLYYDNSTEFPPLSSDIASKLLQPSGTIAPTDGSTVGNKRPIRNATHSHPINDESKLQENSTAGSKRKQHTFVNDNELDPSVAEEYPNATSTNAEEPTTESTLQTQGNLTMPLSTESATASDYSLLSLTSSVQPELESANTSIGIYRDNQTALEETYLTTEPDISNDTLIAME